DTEPARRDPGWIASTYTFRQIDVFGMTSTRAGFSRERRRQLLRRQEAHLGVRYFLRFAYFIDLPHLVPSAARHSSRGAKAGEIPMSDGGYIRLLLNACATSGYRATATIFGCRPGV